MFVTASSDLLEAVQARRRQLRLRLLIGVVMTATLGGMLGWGLVVVWFAAWAGVQVIESVWAAEAERRSARGEPVSAAVALAFVVATNTIFNGLALAAILHPSPWTIICGIWIVSGALLNTVGMSRTSTPMFLAGAAPSTISFAAVTLVALRQGASMAELAGLAAGSTLLVMSVLVLRRLGLEAVTEARRASAAKSIFLANMSHEIRTPLNGVLGMAQAMAADDLPAAQRDRLDVIVRSGEALLGLLNDLLDFSKIEAGKLELDFTAIDPERIAGDLCEAFGATCADKDVMLSLTVDPAVSGAWIGDPVRFRQVLSNLIANAVKFTTRGAVRVELRLVDGAVEAEVRDTGVGIAPDRLDAIFEKFVQADSSTTRDFGGTGLGLAISRDLARLMGGGVSVASTPGQGSVFTLRLPMARAEPLAAPATWPIPAALPERALRVLVADDHKTNQAVLQVMLGQAGIGVEVVDNGQEAVDAWEAEDWDLVLMDVQMPVLDGPSAVREIRARERVTGRAHTPIVALTANAMRHHVEEYLACGMDAFVAKPFAFQNLLQVMSSVLDDADQRALASGPAAAASGG